MSQLQQIIDSYDAKAPLDHAETIPASWYTNQELYDLEVRTVFSNTWQYGARLDQVRRPVST